MQNNSNNYITLKRSYKGAYPFKLATTSFIYPDHYVPNVNMLGPYFDEIELLLFESRPVDGLPGPVVIAELVHLAEIYDLTYNIHLPTDIAITDPRPSIQKQAIAAILRIIDLTSPLSPSGYVLHIPYNADSFETEAIKKWQNHALSNLKKILAAGIQPGLISIETLDYPCELLTHIISELDLNICLDLGHLLRHGYDIKSAFNSNAAKITMIHLHGFVDNSDHLALNNLPEDAIEPVFWILRQFTKTVCLEVFSFEGLQASLAFLEKHWI